MRSKTRKCIFVTNITNTTPSISAITNTALTANAIWNSFEKKIYTKENYNA